MGIRFTGYSWHVEKRKGYSKNKKTCFNCKYFDNDDKSCYKKNHYVLTNNAPYCSEYINNNVEDNNKENIKGYKILNNYSMEDIERFNRIIREKKKKEKKCKRMLTSEEKRNRRIKSKNKKNTGKKINEYNLMFKALKNKLFYAKNYHLEEECNQVKEEIKKLINLIEEEKLDGNYNKELKRIINKRAKNKK